MSLPLKTGADFYNNEAARMRLHNLGADPTEYAAGLIYFNSSTNANTSKKIRVCMGSGEPLWKTLAYAEDLDVASNADFQNLKARVDAFLDGGVDSDGVLENLKEIQAFLDNYSSATDLSDILATKLDKTGGELEGSLTPKSSSTYNLGGSSRRWKGVWTDEINGHAPITSGGGNLYGDIVCAEGVDFLCHLNKDLAAIAFNSDHLALGVPNAPLKLRGSELIYYNGSSTTTILHSGNIGDYNAGSASMLRFITRIAQKGFDANTALSGGGFAFNYNDISLWGDTVPSMSYGVIYQLQGYNNADTLAGQLAWDINHHGSDTTRNLWWRACDDTGFANAKWHQIAFTDSTVAKAYELVSKNNLVGASVNTTGELVVNKNAVINGGAVYKKDDINVAYYGPAQSGIGSSYDGALMLAYGERNLYFYTNYGIKMLINSSGNVTIGASDLAGTNAKLYVDGKATFSDYITCTHIRFGSSTGLRYTSKEDGSTSANGINWYKSNFGSQIGSIGMCVENNAASYAYIGENYQNTWFKVSPTECYVQTKLLIGQKDDNSGAKLQVNGGASFGTTGSCDIFLKRTSGENYIHAANSLAITTGNNTSNIAIVAYANKDVEIFGNLKVNGNIVADGEVSAGGVAAEGGGTSGGGGGSAAWSQTFTPTTTSITFTHTLGTQDVIVQVYEKDSITGYWNLIICDIEVLSNQQVTLHFGQTENIEHKVVIMG